jgi:hypothetical protein
MEKDTKNATRRNSTNSGLLRANEAVTAAMSAHDTYRSVIIHMRIGFS